MYSKFHDTIFFSGVTLTRKSSMLELSADKYLNKAGLLNADSRIIKVHVHNSTFNMVGSYNGTQVIKSSFPSTLHDSVMAPG